MLDEMSHVPVYVSIRQVSHMFGAGVRSFYKACEFFRLDRAESFRVKSDLGCKVKSKRRQCTHQIAQRLVVRKLGRVFINPYRSRKRRFDLRLRINLEVR